MYKNIYIRRSESNHHQLSYSGLQLMHKFLPGRLFTVKEIKQFFSVKVCVVTI